MKRFHPFQRRVLQYIRQEQLIARTDSILVAVSGGPDSLALLHVLVALQEFCGISQMAVLHFDHQIRGAASTADQVFVETLAAAFGVPFHAASEDVRAHHRRHRISLEMAARVCRQRFFREALIRSSANAIALGHTANDQAEEVLLRLFRGTGPAGMAGMLPRTGDNLIRPLLCVTRKEVLAYLRDQQLTFHEDSSNLDPAHQRNAIRHGIFPLLEKHFHPRVVEVLCRHTRLANEEEALWGELLAKQWQALCVTETASHTALDAQRLLHLHPALQRRLLRLAIERLQGNLEGIYSRHLEALCTLLAHRTPGRSIRLPRGLRAMTEGELLILSTQGQESPPPAGPEYTLIMNGPGLYRFPSFALSLLLRDLPGGSADSRPFPNLRHIAWLDADRIRWPLFLRSWQEGDRFCPLGLGGTKKLQDFFVDEKVPSGERRRVLLLCDQEKICWVLDYRLDDRVKITPLTRRMLTIEKFMVA
jgi:tRNA(Ile)-lysidine synthase